MKFTERMRESLGDRGPHLRVRDALPEVARGQILRWTVLLHSGVPVRVEGFIVRLVEAHRAWTDDEGYRVEHPGETRPPGANAVPTWERKVIAERDIPKALELPADATQEVDLELEIPQTCHRSTAACSHMLNVQARVEGQIDPAVNVRLTVVNDPS